MIGNEHMVHVSSQECTDYQKISHGGYRDSARLLGESCTKKTEGPSGEKIAPKSRNSCQVNGQGCGC